MLNKVIRIGLIERPIEKLTFEKILKTGEGVSKVALEEECSRQRNC